MNKLIAFSLALAFTVVIALAKPTPPIRFGKAGTPRLPQLTRNYTWNPVSELWNLTDTIQSFYSASDVLTETVKNGIERIVFYESPNGNMVKQTTLKRASIAAPWDSAYLSVQYKDSHGNDTLNMDYNYNTSNSTWSIAGGRRMANTYNSSSKLVAVVTNEYNQGKFDPSMKNDYVYNSQGFIYQIQSALWDTATKAFAPDSKMTDIVWYKWNATLDNSVLQSWRTLIYMGGGVYLDFSRDKTIFDNHDEPMLYQTESYDGSNWTLQSKDTMELSYDSTSSLISRITSNFDLGNSIYLKSEKQEYGNFVTHVGINESVKAAQVINAYPNPVNDVWHIELPNGKSAKVNVYDLNGRLVFSQQLEGQINDIRTTLTQGEYFYLIQSEENKLLGKGKLLIK